MQNSGKWLIVFIFGTALAMAIFAWSFQYLRGRRVLELYGADAARLIRVDADRVELLVIDAGDADATEHLKINEAELAVVDVIDITKARGLIHARQAFIEDSSYEWQRPPSDCVPQWAYALRFSRGEQHVTTAVDVTCRRMQLVETGAEAPLAKHFVAGLQKFVDEQISPPAAAK